MQTNNRTQEIYDIIKLNYDRKELAIKVIDEISDMDLDEIAKQVMEDNNKWNQYKKLV